jgi:hypothetical protein
MCGAVAPWLVFEPDGGRRTQGREEIAAQLVDELVLAADQGAASPIPPVSSPLELRARQLLEVLAAQKPRDAGQDSADS